MENRTIRALLLAVLFGSGFTLSPWSSTAAQTTGLQIDWVECSIVPDENDGLAECASVEMPLVHAKPDSATIDIAVIRLRATEPSRGQLWFIEGGPGASGVAGFAGPAAFAAVFPDLDIYSLDHRGVGGSGLLECPDQQSQESEDGRQISDAEMEVCIATITATRGDELHALTTTESANDLAALVAATLPEDPHDQKVWVWAASYGTYLINRYLQLFPDQPDGVIMDGLVPADWSFSEFDKRVVRRGSYVPCITLRDLGCRRTIRQRIGCCRQQLSDVIRYNLEIRPNGGSVAGL
jgi:hypothetical protein